LEEIDRRDEDNEAEGDAEAETQVGHVIASKILLKQKFMFYVLQAEGCRMQESISRVPELVFPAYI
jgi:hypothetical protein